MSWWGSHPVITNAEARALLPPNACKRCVYYARVNPTSARWLFDQCTRCGNPERHRR